MRTIPCCLLAASLFTLAASAQDRRGPADRPPRRGAPMERIMRGGDVEQNFLLRLLDNPRIAEEIQLTPEQRTTLTEVFKKFEAELEALRPKLEEAIKVQSGLFGEIRMDEARLMAAVEDTWKIRTEIAKIQTRKLLALRSHLTVDQINRAREMMQNHRQRMDASRNRGDGGGRRQRPEGGARGNRPRRPARQDAPFTPKVEP